jgi:hypothetical protein
MFDGDFERAVPELARGTARCLPVGRFLLQNAHTRGTPRAVDAGVTTIDPVITVTIGTAVVGESDTTPPPAIVLFLPVRGAHGQEEDRQLLSPHPAATALVF